MTGKPHSHLEAISLLEPDAAFWTVDEAQNITFWSQGAENLLGFSQEEVLGKHCSVAINCVRCATGCGLQRRGHITAKALPHYHKDGSEILALKWAQATYDEAGNYQGGVEILRPAQPEAISVKSKEPIDFFGILTGDPRFAAQLTGLRHVAHTQVNVLIRGETGSGKEMVAKAIHRMSPRASKPFVAINCGTLSREFLASEIFGHRRGAFTGAVADKQGLLAKAEGGTLFLDEVAELPMDVQAMLLRVIQERRYTPLGDTRDRSADIRLISATHASLREAAAQGRFREDLLFRLRVVPVFLPPLRDRQGDVRLLLDHMLHKFSKDMGSAPPRIATSTWQTLTSYPWPGNVRELINLAEYLTVTRPGIEVANTDLLPEFHEKGPVQASVASTPVTTMKPARVGHKLNREVVEDALNRAGGVTDEAARLLGVSRVTLWRWRKKLNLN